MSELCSSHQRAHHVHWCWFCTKLFKSERASIYLIQKQFNNALLHQVAVHSHFVVSAGARTAHLPRITHCCETHAC